MDLLIPVFRILMAVGLVLVIGNFFRIQYIVFATIIRKSEVDTTQIKNSNKLLYFWVITQWIMLVVIFIWERTVHGNPARYELILTMVLGGTLFVVSIISAASAYVTAFCKKSANVSCVPIYKKQLNTCFLLALLIWVSLWIMV